MLEKPVFLGYATSSTAKPSHFYYLIYTLDFANLRCFDQFLASQSLSHRQLIKHVKFTYAGMEYEFNALNLLATCTGLETLNIEAGLQYLKPDSPRVFALRKIRGLRSLRFSGSRWTYAVPKQVQEQLHRDTTRRTKKKLPYSPSTLCRLEQKSKERSSRRHKLQSYARRMASLRPRKQ